MYIIILDTPYSPLGLGKCAVQVLVIFSHLQVVFRSSLRLAQELSFVYKIILPRQLHCGILVVIRASMTDSE